MNYTLHFLAKSSGEEATGIAALGFDVRAFLIQLITFLFVFYILKRFVFGIIVDLLEKRRKTIEEGVKLTTEMKLEKEKLDTEVQNIRVEARKHADEILSEAQARASSIIKEAENSAQSKIEMLVAQAHQKLERETEQAKRAVEKEAINLVVRATEMILKEKIDPKKDAELINSAIKEQA